MFGHLDFLLDGISPVYTESIVLTEPFINFASRFVRDPGTVVLLSGGNPDCGKYNILGYKPWLCFRGKHLAMNITVDGVPVEFEGDPIETLKHLLNTYDTSKTESDFPISSGLMGYLSYELSNKLENLPLSTIDDSFLPDICFFIPSIIVVQDVLKGTAKLFVSSSIRGGINSQEMALKSFNKKINLPYSGHGSFFSDYEDCSSNLTHSEYVNAVKKIKKYISEGHVYQVNMSQRFDAGFYGDEFAFFKTLYDINPAPFFAYINAVDHQIISSSPERLIMQNRNKVETRPIKGTRPRGETLEIDKLMKDELLNSRKDDAELSMIVDLLRNDLGKVCRVNSIKVNVHKKIEAYHNVYHLVSIIQGELGSSNGSVDLIKAVFPGGSITGCPKIRAMEIIDELEINRRHVYTGSIGYISFHNTMDLSVAIRTATICNKKVCFSVGGGIVYDSDPEDEFNETLYKGKTIMDIFADTSVSVAQCHNGFMPWVWVNGIIKSIERVSIPIYDLGFMYGYGFFETLLVENRRAYLLEEHITRFNESWTILFKTPFPTLTWNTIIEQVLEANGVKEETIVIKIMATRGNKTQNPLFNGSIFVLARPYKQRLTATDVDGLKVAIYPKSRQTPLAVHKTLNYLYYYLAGLWATTNGFDEAIILNPDGSISEGNSSNIFFIYGKKVVLPKSNFVLRGVMLSEAIKKVEELGYTISRRVVKPTDLFNADAVLMTNSLMGIVSVSSINNIPINYKPKIAEAISKLCKIN